MKSFWDSENECQATFSLLGNLYHLWTSEDFQIIFSNEDDFKYGMNVLGICSKLFDDVKIITYQLMSNHLHILAVGKEERIKDLFNMFIKYISRHYKNAGRYVDWKGFTASIRELTTLEDARNVIVYINRNGYLVNPEVTPFTYKWGANSYFFNADLRELIKDDSREMPVRQRRTLISSHVSDNIRGLRVWKDCIDPNSFCRIDIGESLFRDASHYFFMLGKNIEGNKAIAKEIGESIFYTDDELYAALVQKCRKHYGTTNPSLVDTTAKLELAKMLHFEYNAKSKQIQRMLKLDRRLLESLNL